MASCKPASCFLSRALGCLKLRSLSSICIIQLLVIFLPQQLVLSLNVDQARDELSSNANGSYTEMHANTQRGEQEHSDVDDDDSEEDGYDDNAAASFLDDPDDKDSEDEDADEEDDKLSFLEDMGENPNWDSEEDYDFDAMDEEDAKAAANSMQAEERAAFLQRWEAHKADRKENGHPDPHGTFAEF